ncbi:WG repeat-containing protein [Leptolyngbya sp. NK1-12]|uniref:WG repeat-containing protein n=1 Tax=Leptolyngbya sp. NK1-12 TaxID=2547451 RepID=A0AA97AJ52_9CYAN|nr:WG repeat-containing protein [Leptolyngbya sp. NK1-12]WNZ24541.1 WG repeat-containing protein [Leptolyngbya sp. NK1-12]
MILNSKFLVIQFPVERLLLVCLLSLTLLTSCTDKQTVTSCLAETSNLEQAQNSSPTPRFIISKNQKSGFIDQTGTVVIEPEFDQVEPFFEDRAAFKANGKWGFIDPRGTIVITPQFESVGNFFDQRAVVISGYKQGLIDPNGNVVVEPQYELLIPLHEQRWAFKQHGQWGIIDPDGTMIANPRFLDIESFSDGLAAVVISSSDQQKIAFTNRSGKIVFELPEELQISPDDGIEGAEHFNHGRLLVFIRSLGSSIEDILDGRRYSRFGYLDLRGQLVIPLRYSSASPFSECLAAVKLKQGYGFINLSGEVVIQPQFHDAGSFHEGLAHISINLRHGYVNTNGKIIVEPQYDDAHNFSEGLASVKVNGKWGAINRMGKMVIEPQFDRYFSFKQGLALIIRNGKRGYIDRAGKLVWFDS